MTSFSPPASVRALLEPKRKRLAKHAFEEIWDGLLFTSFFQGAMRWDESNASLEKRAQLAGQALRKRVETGKHTKPFDEDLEGASVTLLRSLIKGGKARGMWSAERVSLLLEWWAQEASPAAAVRCLVTALGVQFWTGDVQSSPRPFGLLFNQPMRALAPEEGDALRELVRAFPNDAGLIDAMRALPPSALRAELTRDAAEARRFVEESKPEDVLGLASLVDDLALARRLVPHLIAAEDATNLLRTVLRWGDALRDLVLVPQLAEWKGEHVAAILTCFPSDEAASLLVASLATKTQRKAAGEALATMPIHAVAALKAAALGKRVKHAAIFDALLASMETSDAPSVVLQDEASVDALPSVLVSPTFVDVAPRALEARPLKRVFAEARAAERASADMLIARNREHAEAADVTRLLRIGDTEIALFACDWYTKVTTRHDALTWVARFPEHAAEALVVETMRGNAQARALLTAMWAGPARRTIARVAKHHGVTGPLRQALEFPPSPKALPEHLETLPRLTLATGASLSSHAHTMLLQWLSVLPLEGDRAIARTLKDAFSHASRDALCIALIKRWMVGGMRVSERWLLHATALIGGDDAVRFLFDQSVKWSADGSERSARLGLLVVAAQGDALALTRLNTLSQGTRKQWLKDEASLLMQEVANARGLDAEAMEDERVIDPKALPSDERARAERDAIEHLTRMMFEERRIPLARFQKHFVSDALRGALVRSIVWGSFERDCLVSTFRVAEDGTFASIDDVQFEPTETASVGPVHAFHLSAEERAKWLAQLADYEIISVLPQLTRIQKRTLAALTAAVTGKQARTQALFALRGRGWRAHASAEGVEFLERFVGDARFVLSLHPPLTQADAPHELAFMCSSDVTPSPIQLDSIALDMERLLGDVP